MNYKIISLDKRLGIITVAFQQDDSLVDHADIEVPIIDGKFITGQALDTLIQSKQPQWLAARTALTAQTTNFAYIAALAVPSSATATN